MSFFRYEAVDRTGKIVMGTMDAPNEAAVSARLSQMGYRPQRVHPSGPQSAAASQQKAVTGAQKAAPSAGVGASGKAPTAKEMALFFRQFATLVRSGISLYQALETLAPRTHQPLLAAAARDMQETARAGGRVSDAMERHLRVFPTHVVGAVRSGEQGGFLEIVLDEIALDAEQEMAFYKGTWLIKLLVSQGLVALAICQPVVPDLFRYPILWGKFFLDVLWNLAIAGVILGGIWLWYRRLQQPDHREERDRLALKMPIFGDLARQKALASFCRTLYHLFQAGISPIAAWDGAMNVAPNAIIRGRLVESYDMVEKGVPIHEAFERTGLFANETEQLLATGVVSGQLVDMMERVAEYYQNNVEQAVSRARFTMFRIGITGAIVLAGLVLIVFAMSYVGVLKNALNGDFPF